MALKNIKNFFPIVSLLVVAFLLSSCGGGGSDGNSSSTNSSSVVFEKNSVSLEAKVKESSFSQIEFTINNVPDEGIFVGLLSKPLQSGEEPEIFSGSDAIFDVFVSDTSASTGLLSISFNSGSEVGRGTFQDTFYIYFCVDESCNTQIQGSPFKFSTTYLVDPKGIVSTQTSKIDLSVNKFDYDYLESPEENIQISVEDISVNELFVKHNGFPVRDSYSEGISEIITDKVNSDLIKAKIEYIPPSYGWAKAGKYNSDIIIDVCHDDACNLPLIGSPITVQSDYNIELGSPTGSNIDPIARTVFSGKVIDSDFSKNLNSIVFATSEPNTVNVFNLNTESYVTFPLSWLPTSLDIDNLGNNIVVGHENKISYISFNQNDPNSSVVLDYDVSGKIEDLSTHNNIAILSFYNEIIGYQIDLTTGAESTLPFALYSDKAKLDINNNHIINADFTSLNMREIDSPYNFIATGHENDFITTTENPYGFDICENMWFSNNDQLIYTACGNVFDKADIHTSNDINVFSPLMRYKGFLKTKPELDDDIGTYFIKSVSDHPGKNLLAYLERGNRCLGDFYYTDSVDLSRPCRSSLNFTKISEFSSNTKEYEFPLFWENDIPFVDSPDSIFFNNSGDSLYILTNLIGEVSNKASIVKVISE